MALGPGKYDEECTRARQSAQAEGCILIIVGGRYGQGVSAQMPPDLITKMPAILRKLADQIEATHKKGEL